MPQPHEICVRVQRSLGYSLNPETSQTKSAPYMLGCVYWAQACSTSDEAEGLRRKKREQLMEAIHGQRFQATMRGMVSILHDATRWIGEISVSHVDSKKLFLAGDHDRAHGTTMFTPGSRRPPPHPA